uniref:BTB domain-containing protein n=1 Tax=Parastrongyloides trichosuri TaxID=131310 RepID=A0A0N4ZJZ4_PARTI
MPSSAFISPSIYGQPTQYICERYFTLLKDLDVITKYGHCLSQTEINESTILLSSIYWTKESYKNGRYEFNHFIQTYHLPEHGALKARNLKPKKDFIKIAFPDGSVVVRKSFLIKNFQCFHSSLTLEENKNVKEIIISDFSVRHFKIILKYFYANTVYFTAKIILELYRICYEFKVDKSFTEHVINYINYFYILLSKTLSFYKYYSYLSEGHLGGINNKFRIETEEQIDDINRLLFIYQWKYNNGISLLFK